MKRLATMTRWGMAAAVAVGLAACAAKAPPAPAQAGRAVSVVRVEMRPIAGAIVTSGVLIPRNQVAINPDLAGYRVSKLYVDEGDWVKAGQPLAEMDSSILRAQLDQQLALAAAQKATADRAREGGRPRARSRQPGRHRRGGVAGSAALPPPAAEASVNAQMASVKRDADPAGAHGGARAGFRPDHPAQRQPRRHFRRRGLGLVRDGARRPDRAQRRPRRGRLRQDAAGRARQGDAGRRYDGGRLGAAGEPAGRRHQPARQGADQPAGARRHPLRRLRPGQLHRSRPRRRRCCRRPPFATTPTAPR